MLVDFTLSHYLRTNLEAKVKPKKYRDSLLSPEEWTTKQQLNINNTSEDFGVTLYCTNHL